MLRKNAKLEENWSKTGRAREADDVAAVALHDRDDLREARVQALQQPLHALGALPAQIGARAGEVAQVDEHDDGAVTRNPDVVGRSGHGGGEKDQRDHQQHRRQVPPPRPGLRPCRDDLLQELANRA